MSFTARLGFPHKVKDELFFTTELAYRFTKNKVHIHEGKIVLARQEIVVLDKAPYILKKLEKDDDFYNAEIKYQALFPNSNPKTIELSETMPINLVTNFCQLWQLRFTHGRTLIQRKKGYIVTTLIGFILSIVLYFAGQNVGFNKGYENGLKEGRKAAGKAAQEALLLNNNRDVASDTARQKNSKSLIEKPKLKYKKQTNDSIKRVY